DGRRRGGLGAALLDERTEAPGRDLWKWRTHVKEDQRRAQAGGDHPFLSPEEQFERKHRLLTQGIPSLASSIAEAVVIKDGNLALLTNRDGQIPLGEGHGLGVFHQDCRFLRGYEFTFGKSEPNGLAHTSTRGFKSVFE